MLLLYINIIKINIIYLQYIARNTPRQHRVNQFVPPVATVQVFPDVPNRFMCLICVRPLDLITA
jgi:hypothetical protein